MSPCPLEIHARPDSARGDTPKAALTLEESCSSSCYSIALWRICRDSNCVAVCFQGGKEGHGCVARRTLPNALMNTAEHQSHSGISSSPENTPALLKDKGFIPSRILTSGRKGMRVPFALLQVPSLLGGYKSSPTWNKTQYFWLKEKYTHGTASGGFLKLFKGKWKGWWLPLGEQLLNLQFTVSTGSLTREEDVWWQKPLSHRPRSSAWSLYCTPKVAPRRTNSGLQLDPAPFQRVLCIQVKHRIPKTMANR